MLVADGFDTALVTAFILVTVMVVVGIRLALKSAINLLFSPRGRPRA
jgi:hypothetical protein